MYCCEEYTRPIWEGNTVWHELFWPVKEREVSLLYPIDEIIEVRSADGETLFLPEKDYRLKDGKLILPEDSAIVVTPWENYNPMEPKEELTAGANFTCATGGYLYCSDGKALQKLQYEISYRHSGTWNGPIPPFDPAALPRTRRLLREKRGLKVGFLGDSICRGEDTSGIFNVAPFMPIWSQMACERLEQVFDCDVECLNKAIGGKTTGWGKENVQKLFADFPVDLFVIAFGMNDGRAGEALRTYVEDCRAIAMLVRERNPECEFAFVSTTLPNPLCTQFTHGDSHHRDYEKPYGEMAKGFGASAVFAPATSMQSYLMTRKHYYDITGNNVNHPNDFMARVLAQTLLRVVVGEF